MTRPFYGFGLGPRWPLCALYGRGLDSGDAVRFEALQVPATDFLLVAACAGSIPEQARQPAISDVTPRSVMFPAIGPQQIGGSVYRAG